MSQDEVSRLAQLAEVVRVAELAWKTGIDARDAFMRHLRQRPGWSVVRIAEVAAMHRASVNRITREETSRGAHDQ